MIKTVQQNTKDSAPGFLQRGKVRSVKGRENYVNGTAAFRKWCGQQNLDCWPMRILDKSLVKYVESLAVEGGSIFHARCAVLGEIWRRSLNLRDFNTLYRARASLEGWKKLIPEGGKDPCPWIIAADLCIDLLAQNDYVDREAAQCIAVQFESYVRPPVATDLKTINVVTPGGGGPKLYDQVALLLAPKGPGESSKNGGVDDSILIGRINSDRQFVSPLLPELKRHAQRQRRLALFPNLTLNIYNHRVRCSGKRLGYASLKLSARLFRHGGPSIDMFEGKATLNDIQKRGHWGSFSSVTRYEKHAKLLTDSLLRM